MLMLSVTGFAGTAQAQPEEARGLDNACEFVDQGDPALDFPDIGGFSEEAQEAIRCIAAYGITTGYTDGTYRPGQEIRRHEMALFMSRVLGYAQSVNVVDLPEDPDHPFEDVAGVSPAAQTAIGLLYELEITTGRTDTTYEPFAPVTRRDMASFLVRLQNVLEPGSYDTDAADIFPDVPSTLPRDEDVHALATQGIVEGHTDGTYRPFAAVTRAHMALFVIRHIDENVDSARLLALDALAVEVDGPQHTEDGEPAEYEVWTSNRGTVDPFEELAVLLNVVGEAPTTEDDVTVEICDDTAEDEGALVCAGDWSELPLEGPDELVYARLPGEDESFALPAGEEVGLLVRLTLEEAGEYEVLAELIGEQTVGTVYDADLRGVLVGPLTACTNPDDVYTLSYPAHWHTNEEALDEVPPCSLFDPVADQIRIDNDEVSTDVGVFLRVEDTDFAEVTGPAVGEEELAREDTTVDGQPAERIEVVATGEGFLPEGTLTTRWAVDLDGETFIAVSHDIGLPLFWQKVLVLDHMMDTITFGPVPS